MDDTLLQPSHQLLQEQECQNVLKYQKIIEGFVAKEAAFNAVILSYMNMHSERQELGWVVEGNQDFVATTPWRCNTHCVSFLLKTFLCQYDFLFS